MQAVDWLISLYPLSYLQYDTRETDRTLLSKGFPRKEATKSKDKSEWPDYSMCFTFHEKIINITKASCTFLLKLKSHFWQNEPFCEVSLTNNQYFHGYIYPGDRTLEDSQNIDKQIKGRLGNKRAWVFLILNTTWPSGRMNSFLIRNRTISLLPTVFLRKAWRRQGPWLTRTPEGS